VARIDNDLSDQFGFVNTSWVFRKVSKALGYRIFMAEASEIGYKRTKRGEKVRENDLFDLEIAPDELDRASVLNEYKTGQDELLHREQKLREELAKGKVSDEKKAILGRRLKLISAKLERLITEKEKVVVGLDTFYEADGKLRSEYKARLNPELLKLFQLPLMKRFSSLAVLIRSSEPKTILDYLRTSKVWR
jgi:type I restriction enzyme M protein